MFLISYLLNALQSKEGNSDAVDRCQESLVERTITPPSKVVWGFIDFFLIAHPTFSTRVNWGSRDFGLLSNVTKMQLLLSRLQFSNKNPASLACPICDTEYPFALVFSTNLDKKLHSQVPYFLCNTSALSECQVWCPAFSDVQGTYADGPSHCHTPPWEMAYGAWRQLSRQRKEPEAAAASTDKSWTQDDVPSAGMPVINVNV